MLLEAELECPTIGTVQGLCLLSSHEAAKGRDARNWLYGGKISLYVSHTVAERYARNGHAAVFRPRLAY